MKILSIASLSCAWEVHGVMETTLLKALAMRGHNIDAYLCDAISPACIVHKNTLTPEQIRRDCADCARAGRKRFREAGLSCRSLREIVTAADMDMAEAWARSLRSDEYRTARYGDWELGEWVYSTLTSKCRMLEFHPEDERIGGYYRGFLQGALLRALAADRLLDGGAYDSILVFNGRFDDSRVALELGKRRGLPVFTHDRGWLKEYISINVNDRDGAMSLFRDAWRRWRGVPLTREEIEAVVLYQFQRELGSETVTNFRSFSSKGTAGAGIRETLGIDAGRKIWALFTSSTDELMADPDFFRYAGFMNQARWIQSAIDTAAAYPDVHLVIRVHPNALASRWGGENEQHDIDLFAKLRRENRPRLSVIEADSPVSTYDLMDAAAAGLSYASTCSLEMALRGKASCCGAPVVHHDPRIVEQAFTPEEMERVLAGYARLPANHRDGGRQVTAFRFLHAILYKKYFPFPVRMPGPFVARFAVPFPECLQPGRHAALDRICQAIALGVRPENAPASADRTRDDADERRLFAPVLDVHASGEELTLRRGDHLLPADGVIDFSADRPESDRFVLSGLGVRERDCRLLARTKDAVSLVVAFPPGAPPARLAATVAVAADAEVELTLNGTALAAIRGDGRVRTVAADIPSAAVDNGLNRLGMAFRGPGGEPRLALYSLVFGPGTA